MHLESTKIFLCKRDYSLFKKLINILIELKNPFLYYFKSVLRAITEI